MWLLAIVYKSQTYHYAKKKHKKRTEFQQGEKNVTVSFFVVWFVKGRVGDLLQVCAQWPDCTVLCQGEWWVIPYDPD